MGPTRGNNEHQKTLYKQFDDQILPMTDIREIPGKGMQGYIGSKLIKLGNSKFCNTKYLKDSKKIHLFLNINDQLLN